LKEDKSGFEFVRLALATNSAQVCCRLRFHLLVAMIKMLTTCRQDSTVAMSMIAGWW